jgi:hypothetical protein
MATMTPYNRKINAPIRFLYYLEVFDLFILLIIGVLAPLFISTFLPVNIPLWHSLIWFVGIFLPCWSSSSLAGRRDFVQHWFGKTFRAKIVSPGP